MARLQFASAGIGSDCDEVNTILADANRSAFECGFAIAKKTLGKRSTGGSLQNSRGGVVQTVRAGIHNPNPR